MIGMAIKLDQSNFKQNPDGTLDLAIPPETIVAEAERQLRIEWMFLFFPVFFSPKRIWKLKKWIKEYKKANGLLETTPSRGSGRREESTR